MNPKIRKILNFTIIFAMLAAVIVIAFSNQELGNAWEAIRQMRMEWLLCVFLCWIVYTLFEALGTWSYLHSAGYKISLLRAIGSVLIGFFYSNITPGASGGQPMQVNSLRKAGVPVGYGTTAAVIRFVCNQQMICLIALVLFLTNRSFVYQQLGGAIWAVRIGWLINFVSVPLVLLAAFQLKWIQKITAKTVRLLSRIRIVHDPESIIQKATESLETYHAALTEMMHRPVQILLQLLFSGISLLGLIGTTVFTYFAFGLNSTPWFQILTISCLLFVSASYTPLPGASGAQEGGFILYFNGIFTDGTIGLGLLTWRFFTYYLFLLTGMATILNEKLLLRSKNKAVRQHIKLIQTGHNRDIHVE